MAQRPVNLSRLVIATFPSELLSRGNGSLLRNATLGCALFLAGQGYVLMQDRIGYIWVQHEKSRVIVQPPGGITFTVSGTQMPLSRWLKDIRDAVWFIGEEALDPNVPYILAVMKLYCGSDTTHVPLSPDVRPPAVDIGGGEQHSTPLPNATARALNPFLAQRCISFYIPLLVFPILKYVLAWISGYLHGMGFTQRKISSLTTEVWQREPNKHLWQNIAALYTAARDRGEPGLVLSEFIKTELAKNGHPATPEEHLRRAGFVIDLSRNRPRGEQRARKSLARTRSAQACQISHTVRSIAYPPHLISSPDRKRSKNWILGLAKGSEVARRPTAAH